MQLRFLLILFLPLIFSSTVQARVQLIAEVKPFLYLDLISAHELDSETLTDERLIADMRVVKNMESVYYISGKIKEEESFGIKAPLLFKIGKNGKFFTLTKDPMFLDLSPTGFFFEAANRNSGESKIMIYFKDKKSFNGKVYKIYFIIGLIDD